MFSGSVNIFNSVYQTSRAQTHAVKSNFFSTQIPRTIAFHLFNLGWQAAELEQRIFF
jgi:hypothetical protein